MRHRCLVLAVAFSSGSVLWAAGMPAKQQNALVQKYCTVCHTDAMPLGGISFQHFDAAHPDPGVVAMMVGKLGSGALGASGQKLPDKPTQKAFHDALNAKAAGAEKWVVRRGQDPVTGARVISAGIVREMPDKANDKGAPDLYRLTLTCRPDAHNVEMRVAWSPNTPKTGIVISVGADGGSPANVVLDKGEKYPMGGKMFDSGPGSAVLDLPLAKKTIEVSNLFGEGTVSFPVGDLSMPVRKQMAACFAAAPATH